MTTLEEVKELEITISVIYDIIKFQRSVIF